MPKPRPTEQQRTRARERIEGRLRAFGGDARVIEVLRVGGGSRPDVAVVSMDGAECVVKDHLGCDRWFGRLLGPLLSRREADALRRLHGLEGVPRLLRVFDRRAFAMSLLDGEPYRGRSLPVEEWRRFFDAMQRLVDDMHARGVAHCDLRSPDNTLITGQGMPAVVDFVASYTRGSRMKPWSAWLFAKMCAVDISAIEKQKRTVCPELVVDPTAAEHGGGKGALDRAGRRFGVTVRRIARRLFTR